MKKTPHPDQQKHREPGNQYLGKEGFRFGRIHLDIHMIFQKVIHHVWIIGRRESAEPLP